MITDTWISLYFKMPMPLAKLGACANSSKEIYLFGGMSADFEPTNKVYKLDLSLATFTQRMPMRFERIFEGGGSAFKSANSYIYLLNGTLTEGECEKYIPKKD